jgi:hypothetical protein
MTIPEENPTDDELADLMNDSEASDVSDEASAGVEAGIPPEVPSEDGPVSNEETFSMDDFDEEMSTSVPHTGAEPETKKPDIKTTEQEEVVAVSDPSGVASPEDIVAAPSPSYKDKQNGAGDVAEFRKSLANLSRQLEIDKLTFLHKTLSETGESLPSLDQIADDIHGNSSLCPDGDLDNYSHRPAARLEGWISGLSFGASRRAKKFSK